MAAIPVWVVWGERVRVDVAIAKACSGKRGLAKVALEKLVLDNAVGEWGCEDLTGVTIVACDSILYDRNWTVIHLQNEDLPAAGRTVLRIVERLGHQYDLAPD